MTSLDHLRTFVTVYRAGSFSEAAAQLGISQPTVTAHMKALEEQLGYPLVTRGTSGIVPTAKGDELARSAAASVDALDDLLYAAAPGAVQLGGASDFLTAMVLPRLAELTTLPVTVTFGLADDLLDSLRAGSLDVVISSVQPHGPGLVAVPFFDEEFVLVGAARWQGVPLEEVPVIAYAPGLPIIRRYWRTVFQRRPEGLRLAAVVPDLRGILAAVSSGAGMSVLPTYLAQTALDEGEVVQLHVPNFAPLNTLYLVTRDGEPFTELSAALAAIR